MRATGKKTAPAGPHDFPAPNNVKCSATQGNGMAYGGNYGGYGTYDGTFRAEQFRLGPSTLTPGVRGLILLNTAVFAAQLSLAPLEWWLGVPGFLGNWFGFQGGDFLRGMVWQPLTYQLLHGGLMHLFMNMLWLYMFGSEVEDLLGTRQFACFYFGCGALAVLASLFELAIFGRNPVIAGASGSVMGVLMAFAMIDPQRRFFLFPFPISVTAAWMVVIVAAMNVLSGVSGSDAAVTTHLGGLAAGYGLMKAIPLWHQWRRERARAKWFAPPRDNGEAEQRAREKAREAVDNIFKFKDRP